MIGKSSPIPDVDPFFFFFFLVATSETSAGPESLLSPRYFGRVDRGLGLSRRQTFKYSIKVKIVNEISDIHQQWEISQ